MDAVVPELRREPHRKEHAGAEKVPINYAAPWTKPPGVLYKQIVSTFHFSGVCFQLLRASHGSVHLRGLFRVSRHPLPWSTCYNRGTRDRREYHTQLAAMSRDEIVDLTALECTFIFITEVELVLCGVAP